MVDIPTISSNNREDHRNNNNNHTTNLWKYPPYFEKPNTFLVMRSEGLRTLRINLKSGRTLELILDDCLEAQDISANATEYCYIFCDYNLKRKNSNVN